MSEVSERRAAGATLSAGSSARASWCDCCARAHRGASGFEWDDGCGGRRRDRVGRWRRGSLPGVDRGSGSLVDRDRDNSRAATDQGSLTGADRGRLRPVRDFGRGCFEAGRDFDSDRDRAEKDDLVRMGKDTLGRSERGEHDRAERIDRGHRAEDDRVVAAEKDNHAERNDRVERRIRSLDRFDRDCPANDQDVPRTCLASAGLHGAEASQGAQADCHTHAHVRRASGAGRESGPPPRARASETAAGRIRGGLETTAATARPCTVPVAARVPCVGSPLVPGCLCHASERGTSGLKLGQAERETEMDVSSRNGVEDG